MSNSVRPHRWQPTRLPCPWDSPGKNTGVGCHCLRQFVKVKSLSRVRLLATPRTAAYQAPPSMGFSRQEYWSRLPIKHLKNDLSLDWDWRYISLGGGCISSSENRASPGAWNTLTAVHSAEMDLWCGHPGAPQSIPLIKLLELPHQEKLKRTPCPKQTV